MKFGLDVPTTGAYADVRIQAQLAKEAEAAGWDGMGWDGMGWDGMGWDGMASLLSMRDQSGSDEV